MILQEHSELSWTSESSIEQNRLFNNHLILFLPLTCKQPTSDSPSYFTPMWSLKINRKQTKTLFIVEPIISGKITDATLIALIIWYCVPKKCNHDKRKRVS